MTARLAQAVAAFGAQAAAHPLAVPDTPAPPAAGPLAGLVHRLNAGQPATAAPAATPELPDRPGAPAPPAGAAPLAELKALRESRGTWARLSVGRQVARSLAKGPDNPGPLNSHQLLLRALQQMQDLSPAYLARFMAHAEALLWLDGARAPTGAAGSPAAPAAPSGAAGPAAAAAAAAPRREPARKRSTGRAARRG